MGSAQAQRLWLLLVRVWLLCYCKSVAMNHSKYNDSYGFLFMSTVMFIQQGTKF